jgi:hypothetical protein
MTRNLHRAIVAMLAAAMILASVMALVSHDVLRVHADELDHIAAGRYYVSHWLPPAAGDPRTLDAYSYLGMSYLNELDIVYPIAGKFVALVQPLVGNEVYSFRLFNVFLFLILIGLAWRKREAILLFSVLLLSPQIWYIFSYFNADAFAFFLAMLAAYEIASPKSAFNDVSRGWVYRSLRIGIYVGLIVLSKKTFWVFIPFLFAYALVMHLRRADGNWAADWRTMVATAAVAAAVIIPRVAWDIHVNGMPAEKTARILAVAAELADSPYRPGAIGTTEYSDGLRLKSRGISFVETVRWFRGQWYWF